MSQLREQAVRCVKRAWSFAKRQSLKLAVGVCMFTLSTGTALANSRHRARRRVQCVLQDAERRPGRKENHYAYHWWLCGFYRYVRGTSALLQVINRWKPDHQLCVWLPP